MLIYRNIWGWQKVYDRSYSFRSKLEQPHFYIIAYKSGGKVKTRQKSMGAWSRLDTPPPVESQILFSCSYSCRNLRATYSPSLLNVFIFASKQLKITQLINSASFTQILNDILLLYLEAKQFLFLSCTFSIARIKKKKRRVGEFGKETHLLYQTLRNSYRFLPFTALSC